MTLNRRQPSLDSGTSCTHHVIAFLCMFIALSLGKKGLVTWSAPAHPHKDTSSKTLNHRTGTQAPPTIFIYLLISCLIEMVFEVLSRGPSGTCNATPFRFLTNPFRFLNWRWFADFSFRTTTTHYPYHERVSAPSPSISRRQPHKLNRANPIMQSGQSGQTKEPRPNISWLLNVGRMAKQAINSIRPSNIMKPSLL